MDLDYYRNLIGTITAIVTVLQLFSPAFICKDIIKKGNTVGSDPGPFLGGIGISILLLQNGLLINDPASILVNVFGLLLNVIYISIYYKYTKNRNALWISISKVIAFVAVLIAYAQREDKELVEFRFGLLITVLLLLLIGSPLFNVGEIIRNEDASSIPIPIVIGGTVVAFFWLLYGIIIHNVFMQIQNFIGLILSTIQIYLYIIYPPNKTSQRLKKSD